MATYPLRPVRNSGFQEIYARLLSDKELSRQDSATLLEAAIYFLNHSESVLRALGYRIVVLYGNKTGDYIPLYDVAINSGLIPVAESALKEIEAVRENRTSFMTAFQSSRSELYRRGDALYSDQQIELAEFVERGDDDNLVLVAPTSYGKSQLITEYCRRNTSSSICIIVPTKALLAQTRRRLLQALSADDRRPILTHPESYKEEISSFISVFTQERLLRFLTEYPEARLDSVIVDEAHNLLEHGNREVLLSQVLILAKSRFPHVKIQFYTPFLVEPEKLKLRHATVDLKPFKVIEQMKSERFFLAEYRSDRSLSEYDPYFADFFGVATDLPPDLHAFVDKFSSQKNIVYINSPKRIEMFARNFSFEKLDIDDEEVKLICDSISEYIHKDYNLVNYIRKGIVYHHGSIPDLVKLYVEDAFSRISSLRWIVCSSTLLEGVNIPAQTMFMLDVKKGRRNLSKSQFKNLVGRVCRFSEVFSVDHGSLKLLEPKIYLLANELYMSSGANVEKFLINVSQADRRTEDIVSNVLLEASDEGENIDERHQADRMLQNLSPGLVDAEIEIAKTEFGRAAFRNNLTEIDIVETELVIERALSSWFSRVATTNLLIDEIARVFVPNLKDGSNYDFLRRLSEPAARAFYAMFLDWRMNNASFNEMIANFLRYWDRPEVDEVYVGKWGDFNRADSHQNHWVNINMKSHSERINLAIVRIKEEQDFVDNFIMKFAETLNELDKMDADFYSKLKFGTIDPEVIRLINSGFNSHLAHLLVDEYSEFKIEDDEHSSVYLDSKVVEKMKQNGENDITVFEAKMHIRN